MKTISTWVRLASVSACGLCVTLAAPVFADPSPPTTDAPLSEVASSEAAVSAAPTGQLANPFVIPPQERQGDYFVNSDDPEGTIPQKLDALTFGYYVMELADKAVEAFRRKEYDRAAKFSRTMAKVVPDRAIGFSKLCEAYEASGKFKEAEEACSQAIQRSGTTVADHARYVELYLRNRPNELLGAEIKQLDELIARIATLDEAKLVAARLECRLGARLEDAERLEKCTTVLNANDLHSPVNISFTWALAIARNDRDAAARELARAEAAGLPAAAIESMRVRGERLLARGMSPRTKLALFGVGFAVVLGAAGTVFARRRRREVAAHA